MLRFAELDFEADTVALEAFEDDGALSWGILVDTVPRPVTQVGATYPWRPRFSADRLFTTSPGEIVELVRLAGCGASWDHVPPDEEAPATLYVFEHTAIDTADFRLSASGDKLVLNWTGVAEFHAAPPFHRHVPFEMNLAIREVVLLAGRLCEAEARLKFEPFLDIAAFTYDAPDSRLRRYLTRP